MQNGVIPASGVEEVECQVQKFGSDHVLLPLNPVIQSFAYFVTHTRVLIRLCG